MVFLIIGLATAGLYYYQHKHNHATLANDEMPPIKLSSPAVSPSSTQIAPSTANWKTYNSKEFGFSIRYPPNLYLHREGYEETNTPKQQWSIHWANLPYEQVKNAGSIPPIGITLKDFYSLGYYDIYVCIDNNPLLRLAYSEKVEPLTEKNLESMFMNPQALKHVSFQGRKAVGNSNTFVAGYLGNEIGESLDYWMIDGKRSIRLSGTTDNLQKMPIENIDQILSTFKFIQ